MTKFFLTCLFSLLGSCLAFGHDWNSVYVQTKIEDQQLITELLFDAGYGVPIIRDNPDAPQPKRPWLVAYPAERHQQLKEEACNILKQYFQFRSTQDETTIDLDSRYTFPDWDTSPPSFPKQLDGYAYLTVKIITTLPTYGSVELHTPLKEEMPSVVYEHFQADGSSQISVIEAGGHLTIAEIEAPIKPEAPPLIKIVKRPFHETLTTGLHLGFIHVLPAGFDHILFIIALCLVVAPWKQTIRYSLLFTLAHSVTFILLSIGYVSLSHNARIAVEVVILLSIIALASENMLAKPNTKRRVILISFFGLVHGLGFASAFGEDIVNHNSSFLVALVTANLGIELAQISVIIVVLGLSCLLPNKAIKEKVFFYGSLGIAITAASMGVYGYILT